MVMPPISESLKRSKNVPLGLSLRIRCRCCFPMKPNISLVEQNSHYYDASLPDWGRCLKQLREKEHLLTLGSSRSSGASWSAPSLLQTTARKWMVVLGEPPVGFKVMLRFEFMLSCVYLYERTYACTLLNWAQETIMLLKSSAKSGLSKIFWAKKCWLNWSRLCFVWTSEVNLLFRVLYIILQGTRSGTTNGTLSWWQRQRG